MLKAKKIEIDRAKNLGGNWVFQLKYDGSRTLYAGGKLISERDIDRTERFKHISNVLKGLNAVLDGEVYIEFGKVFDVSRRENWDKVSYVVFDILELDGSDLRGITLEERQKLLQKVLVELDSPKVHYPLEFKDFNRAWEYVKENGLEGLIAKDLNSQYPKGELLKPYRSGVWLKIKNWKEGKEEVVGFESGSRKGTFITRSGNRISALSEGWIQKYEDLSKKGRVICEFFYLYTTEKGHYFQPILKRLENG